MVGKGVERFEGDLVKAGANLIYVRGANSRKVVRTNLERSELTVDNPPPG